MIEPFLCVTIDPDGIRQAQAWEIPNADAALLKKLQETVEGYVEVVTFTSKLHLWVNEDGAFTRRPNPYLRRLAFGFDWDGYFFGTGVLTGGADEYGNTQPLTEEQVKEIMNLPWPKRVVTVNGL